MPHCWRCGENLRVWRAAGQLGPGTVVPPVLPPSLLLSMLCQLRWRGLVFADAQNLVERILRLRIYNSQYWKEACFGLTGTLRSPGRVPF